MGIITTILLALYSFEEFDRKPLIIKNTCLSSQHITSNTEVMDKFLIKLFIFFLQISGIKQKTLTILNVFLFKYKYFNDFMGITV